MPLDKNGHTSVSNFHKSCSYIIFYFLYILIPIPIIFLFLLSCKLQGGRGHWTVSYIGTQSFKTTTSYWFAQKFGYYF